MATQSKKQMIFTLQQSSLNDIIMFLILWWM